MTIGELVSEIFKPSEKRLRNALETQLKRFVEATWKKVSDKDTDDMIDNYNIPVTIINSNDFIIELKIMNGLKEKAVENSFKALLKELPGSWKIKTDMHIDRIRGFWVIRFKFDGDSSELLKTLKSLKLPKTRMEEIAALM